MEGVMCVCDVCLLGKKRMLWCVEKYQTGILVHVVTWTFRCQAAPRGGYNHKLSPGINQCSTEDPCSVKFL